MKQRFRKWINLFTVLLPAFAITNAKAYTGENKDSSLKLLYTSGVIAHDTLQVQNNVQSISTPADVKLQSVIKKFVAEYVEENGGMLEDIKLKNNNSFATIERILQAKGIPVQLKYLAVIESKLKNTATSGAGAAGIWQLMPVTARSLGLRVNGKTDERRHLSKSSAAAANYLNELYNEYDDWLLVVAAYNCGAGNVNKAIKKSGSREFWKLQVFLPAETRKHVKKFIATHYYYEEKGSIVTLTKTERKKYLASINQISNRQPAAEAITYASAAIKHFNWVLVTVDGDEVIFEARK